MNVFGGMDALGAIPAPLSIAAGVFDGMHLGHRAVLGAALDAAQKSGGSAVALTFDPHPSKILRPEQASRLLTSTAHKLDLMRRMGVRHALVIPFDKYFAEIEAEDFARSLVRAAPGLKTICVGEGWKFGRARRGDVNLLRAIGAEAGFETTEVGQVSVGGLIVSSTRIRQAVETGDLATAEILLGRKYSVLGTVKKGDGLGAKLGFPTANLAAHNEQFPPDGVYATNVLIEGTLSPGVANIGTRPTVASSGERLMEVHVFGFSGDLYGTDIEAEFVRFLRPEKKFSGTDALREQIAADAEAAQKILG